MPNQGVIITEDASQYYAVITTYGNKKIAQALATETPLQLKTIAVGDGGGSEVYPNREIKELVNEVWRGDCVTMLDLNNPNTIVAKTNVPIDVGGWNVREIAVMDDEDNIIIHANAPGWRKLAVINGTSNPMEISARVTVIDAAAIELNISYDGVNVTFKDLEAHIKDPHAHPHFNDPVPHVSEDERKYWSGFANTGPMTTEDTDFVITPALNITSELFSLTVKTPKAFVEGDTITVNEISYTLYQGNDPASDDAFNSGEVITLNFDTVSRRCWASSGGTGAPKPLPPQISNLKGTVPEGETPQIIFTWTNPVDENFAGMILVVKEGSAPNGVTDGTQVYKGTGTTFTYTEGVQWERTYYGRGFAYNLQDKFQMDATGAIASATPTNTPAVATNFQISTDFDEATMTWENPDSLAYSKTIIMQKIGGIPQSITDGTQVYSGTDTSTKVTGLQDKVVYYWRAFTVSATNKYNKIDAPHVTYTPRLVPDSWAFEKCITSNEEWTPDETTMYRVTCIGKSGDGTSGSPGTHKDDYRGGNGGNGGGTGGISCSILKLSSDSAVHVTVTSSISSFGDYLSATAANGTTAGTAFGGNEFNIDGNNGGTGGKGGHDTFNNIDTAPKRGSNGGGNGAKGGSATKDGSYFGRNGGGGGGGASFSLPEDIPYDDPLYTKYIIQDLSDYKGGNGGVFAGTGKDATSGDSYPQFSADNPIWYGGGNGGGGGNATNTTSNPGAAGSAGSPGGILIEKGVFS